MRSLATSACIATALFCYCGTARAQDTSPPKVCELGQAGSFDLTTGAEGMVFLTGSVEGHSGKFVVDTGGFGTLLSFSTATHLGGGPQEGPMGVRLVGGIDLRYGIWARDFKIGSFKFPASWFVIGPDRFFSSNAIGNIQPHSLWPNYDTEIDFWKGKLNLFLTNQCPGHEVYWTHDPYAAVPMTVNADGHITVQAYLDGKPINALIDTGSQKSFLSLKAASHIFSIDEKTPGMVNRGQVDINGLVEAKRYHYPFKSLTFEGISIAGPDIEINDAGNDFRGDEIILGIGVLRQLHLFIAYDENKLYLTAAEAH